MDILLPYVKIGMQILILIAIWLIAGLIHRHILPFIPQGFLGMMFLFFMLVSRFFPLNFIAEGSRFLIAHMPLLFIPSVVQIIEYKELLIDYGITIIASIFLGSIVVMFSVGFVVDKIYAYELRQKQQKEGVSK